MGKFNLEEKFSRSFDKIFLPSKGEFYEDGTKSLLVRYLSGLEEKVLTSHFLTESGEALEMVLENLVLEDFDIRKLIISDLQGIMIFLYATAYGDKIPYNMDCPSCGFEDETSIHLSEIDFKETDSKPVDGCFSYLTPMKDNFVNKNLNPTVLTHKSGRKFLEVLFTPMTFGDDLDLKREGINNTGVYKVINSIKSIGGVENKDYIRNSIRKMNFKDFKSIKKFSEQNDIALDDKVKVECPNCGYENEFQFNFGYNFLKLPETHKEAIMEECFLISHYAKGGKTDSEALRMPVLERRWYLQRVSEEIDKKREAEKKAMDGAKSKK